MIKKNYKTIFDAFFKRYKKLSIFSSHLITSFNYFLNNDIEQIVKEYGTVNVENNAKNIRGEFSFFNIRYTKPSNGNLPIYPNVCRNDDITYAITVWGQYKLSINILEYENAKWKNILDYKHKDPVIIMKIPDM